MNPPHEDPQVSAVIPVHNRATYVGVAVESALSQTYPHVEVVVVDDGSTDDIDGALAPYRDDIRVVRQSQQGVSAARNAGIEASSGEYVAFLDSDDIWLPRKLEHQMALFRDSSDLGLVYTALHVVDEELRFIGRESVPDGVDGLRNTLLLERPIMTIGSGGVVPALVLEEVGLFDTRMSTSSDCDLACRIALHHQVAAVHKPLVLYRLHGGQIHLDPDPIEHDMRLIFEKFLDDGLLAEAGSRHLNRALANLYVSLAGAHLNRGDYRQFLVHAVKALFRRPDRVLDAVRRLSSPDGGLTRN